MKKRGGKKSGPRRATQAIELIVPQKVGSLEALLEIFAEYTKNLWEQFVSLYEEKLLQPWKAQGWKVARTKERQHGSTDGNRTRKVQFRYRVLQKGRQKRKVDQCIHKVSLPLQIQDKLFYAKSDEGTRILLSIPVTFPNTPHNSTHANSKLKNPACGTIGLVYRRSFFLRYMRMPYNCFILIMEFRKYTFFCFLDF